MHNASDRTDYWDAKAEGYLARLQQKQSDLLLETLAEVGAIPEAGTVLDVCCGPGWHLSQLAGRISRGLGVDSSPGMIAQARRAAIAAGIDNVEFQQLDWQREPISQEKFDLVMASKCPAVRTPEDVVRLQELSRGWCVNTSPVYRHIDVLDVLLERMDINAKQDPHGGAQMMADKLVALWQSGAAPELRYEGGEFVTPMDRKPCIGNCRCTPACMAMNCSRQQTPTSMNAGERPLTSPSRCVLFLPFGRFRDPTSRRENPCSRRPLLWCSALSR